jgi:hypothetical protein
MENPHHPPEENYSFHSYLSDRLRVQINKLSTIVFYLIQDLKRGPLQFKIAVFSVFLTVSFMTILLNVNPILMSMFLTATEREVGDADFIITPSFDLKNLKAYDFKTIYSKIQKDPSQLQD